MPILTTRATETEKAALTGASFTPYPEPLPEIAELMRLAGHDNQAADRGRSAARDPRAWLLVDQMLTALRRGPGNMAANRLYRERLRELASAFGYEDKCPVEMRQPPMCRHQSGMAIYDRYGVVWCTGCWPMSAHANIYEPLDLVSPWDAFEAVSGME